MKRLWRISFVLVNKRATANRIVGNATVTEHNIQSAINLFMSGVNADDWHIEINSAEAE